MKEHSQQQAVRREQQELKRQEAIKASAELTQALVDHLNVGVAQAYLNQVNGLYSKYYEQQRLILNAKCQLLTRYYSASLVTTLPLHLLLRLGCNSSIYRRFSGRCRVDLS